MKIIKIDPKNPSLEAIKKAARIIKNGGVIVYPTDTCYGLGTSAFDEKAIKKVYKIKGRNFNKPLSIIIRSLKSAKVVAKINKKQEEYFKEKLPGPYTLIFKKKKILPNILTGGLETVGIRLPKYRLTKLLSEEVLIPYTATSANISGQPPCYSIADFLKQISQNSIKPDLILDAGSLPRRPLSRIIDLTGYHLKILR